MKPMISLALTIVVGTTNVAPTVAQSVGTMLSFNQVPTYIPEHHRLTWYDATSLPSGWGAAVPSGGAIATSGSGKIEIKAFKLMCDVPGKSGKQTVVDNVSSIGGGQFMLTPWFGTNNYSEPTSVTRTSDGTAVFDVVPNRIMHWWTVRGALPAGTSNCITEATVRGIGNVIASVGATWWRTIDNPWTEYGVSHREHGGGNWYDLSNQQWQTIIMPAPQ